MKAGNNYRDEKGPTFPMEIPSVLPGNEPSYYFPLFVDRES